MATTPHSHTFIADFETASERMREANERVVELGPKFTDASLTGFERYVTGLTALERKVGEQTPVEPLATLLDAHAQMTDELTRAGVAAARTLVAA